MTYTTNVPQSGQSLGSSRSPINTNFSLIQQAESQDHVPISSSGQGKHNKSTYVEQAGDPVTASNECAQYSKDVSGVTQEFIRGEFNGNVVQMTRLDTGASNGARGFSFLPGGLIIQWGAETGISNNSTINFPLTFPNAVYSLQVSGGIASGTQPTINFNQATLTTALFNAKIDGTTPINLYWVAIGK